MPNISVRTKLPLILFMIFAAVQLAACSSGGDTGSAASQALMTWVAPSEREDGTPISMTEIAGYRVYYSDAQGSYQSQFEINDPYDVDVSSVDLKLASGTHYVVVTTVDTNGRESAFSKEVVLQL